MKWDEPGEIPSVADLKHELNDHVRYIGLHSQSNQHVLEKHDNGDTVVNYSGYRMRGDNYPRSTVSGKQKDGNMTPQIPDSG